MRRILLSILLSLLASSSFAGGPGLLFTAGGSPPTTPVITATPGDTTNTITLVSGDVGALTNVLYWDTTSRATYDLYANSISNATLVAASFPGTPYVHTGRTNGVPYYYMLRGTDVAGSTSSAEVSGTPAAGGVTFANAVQYTNDTSSATVVSPSITVADGGTIVAGVAESGYLVDSVTCGPNTLTNAKDNIVSGYTFSAFYISNAVAYTGTCTATFQGSATYRNIIVTVGTGLATTSALNGSSCNSAGCNAIASSSSNLTAQGITTTNANDVILVISNQWNNTATFTGANGYTSLGVNSTMNGIFWKQVASTGTYPGVTVATTAAADEYISIGLAFKVAP